MNKQERLTEVVVLKMPPSLVDQLRTTAQAEDRPQASIIRIAVREYLSRNNKPVTASQTWQGETANGFVLSN